MCLEVDRDARPAPLPPALMAACPRQVDESGAFPVIVKSNPADAVGQTAATGGLRDEGGNGADNGSDVDSESSDGGSGGGSGSGDGEGMVVCDDDDDEGALIRRPRWLGRWSACLLRSSSWVRVSPSAPS